MKRKTAKEVLVESFREIAERKDVDKITVKDITENCGYSPATFYRQFRDKYALIAWDYARELERIMSGLDGSREEWQKALRRAADFFQAHKGYLANLFLHTSGYESFIIYMREVNFESLRGIAEKYHGNNSVDEMTVMYIRFYVLGTVQFTCEWILGRIEATPEELAMVYEQTVPAPLQAFLRRMRD